MNYGAVMFPTEYAMAPDELARALEERGEHLKRLLLQMYRLPLPRQLAGV
jgi:hypothetical protein